MKKRATFLALAFFAMSGIANAYTLVVNNKTQDTFIYQQSLPPVIGAGDIQPESNRYTLTFSSPRGTCIRYFFEGSVIGGLQIKPNGSGLTGCGGWSPQFVCKYDKTKQIFTISLSKK